MEFISERQNKIYKYNKLRLEGKFELGENDTLIPWREFRSTYKNKDENKSKEILRYYHAFTKEELEGLLRKTGFEIKDIYYVKSGERVSVNEGYNICTIAENI